MLNGDCVVNKTSLIVPFVLLHISQSARIICLHCSFSPAIKLAVFSERFEFSSHVIENEFVLGIILFCSGKGFTGQLIPKLTKSDDNNVTYIICRRKVCNGSLIVR